MDLEEYKRCSKCGNRKLRSEFHKSSAAKDGLNYFCKDCNKLSVMEYRKRNPTKIKEAMDKYRLTHARQRLVNACKYRAKKLGVPFNISEEDLDFPKVCYYTGINIDYGINKGRHDSCPSVDRIIPYLGYIKGNVLVVSDLGNRMKSNATPKQLRHFAKRVLEKWPD